MFSQFDLIEELTNIAHTHDFVHSEDIELLRKKGICISGSYFIGKMLSQANSGDLLTGFSIKVIKTQIDQFLHQTSTLGLRFKLVFNGSELYVDKQHFTHQCQIKKRFFHLLWKLEVMKCLKNSSDTFTEGKSLSESINNIKSVVYRSGFYRHFAEREIADFIYDYLFEKEVEFLISPGKAVNQMVWLYSYDYCEAVVGDLSILPFAETVPQVILDLDFEKKTFSYINLKDFSEALKIVKGKERRQAEIWAFSVPNEQLVESDVLIISALEEKIMVIEDKIEKLRKERSDKVKSSLDKINCVLNTIDTSILNDKAFAEQMSSLTGDKTPKREQIIYRLDNGQVVNSSCEYSLFPATKTYTMSETDKQKLRTTMLIDFAANKKLYPFFSFDIFNPQFLLLTTKATRHQIYFGPPVSDSKEYRSLMEDTLPKDLETAFSTFLSIFGKLCLINDYMLASYCVKESTPLIVKEPVMALESGDKVLFYFKEAAFKRFEKDNANKGADVGKISFKNTTSMIFQCLSAAAESSDLTLTQLSLKKTPGHPDLCMTRKEILGLIMVNMLDDLEFVSIKQKKFMILGAGLMRKVTDVLEEKIILLLELIKLGFMNGDFMNPPEMSLMRHKRKDDKYLVNSLRKTSEELRNKNRSPKHSRDDDHEVVSSQKRKESEFTLQQIEGDLNREPTIYDYEKTVNVISLTIKKYKEGYEHYVPANKQLIDDSIDMFGQGLQDKSVLRIITISRVFCLIDAESSLKNPLIHDHIQDFDTSQFLSVLGLVQKLLRFKVEGLFSVAVNCGNKGLLLKEIEEIKIMLPFRTAFNGQLSNLIKILLTQHVLLSQISKGSKSDFSKQLDDEFSWEGVQSANPNFSNLKETLLAGYHLFMSLVRVLEYGVERGIDKSNSPAMVMWIESRDLLRDCFKRLGLTD